jgi:phosphohistidine swiveling domain-containing protein
LPELPEVTPDATQTFRRFSGYCERHLQGLRRDHYEVVTRCWLVRAAINMLADPEDARVPPLHKTLGKLLANRARTLNDQAERARADLERQDEALQAFVTALVTRGATDFSGMFVGDRQHHASLAELKLWSENPTQREALGASWESEKAAFAARQPEAAGETPAEIAPPRSLDGRGAAVVGLVPGQASGPAHAPEPRAEPSPGKILFLADGGSEYAPHVVVASGVVLTGGGLASPAAALARELGIPTVACVQRKPLKSYPLGSNVTLDGSASSLRF